MNCEEALVSDVDVFKNCVRHKPTGTEFVAYSERSQSGNLTFGQWKLNDGRVYDERAVRELLRRCWLKELQKRGVMIESL